MEKLVDRLITCLEGLGVNYDHTDEMFQAE